MSGGDTVALAASVDLGYCAHAEGGADVDVPDEGGAPNVVPVSLVGGQLLEAAGLDEVHEFGDGKLAGPKGKTNIVRTIDITIDLLCIYIDNGYFWRKEFRENL